ncbi:hypothetical protein [Runella salmonicolor]|uniref:Uncharacterized protein n=1 Tax=Runella salmonicolor TaxID=2950278 RepID=A0ABT1FPU3_9BACT|nr:hypothetical protein [Runella salmonicolor]MCP1383785.1 hypothetical protein [Runella salmonicolor]
MAGKTLIFTVCTAEHYPFAQALADSLPKELTFKVGMVGEVAAGELDVVQFRELPFEVIPEMQQRYDKPALVAAAKPFFASYFLQQNGIENVIYFDPTTFTFGDFDDILQKSTTYDIVLTPRLTRKFGKSTYGDEKMFLNTGMYDNGFFAVRKSQNTFRFLEWWQQRLTDRAYLDLCNGMNHDQLWLNYVPILFENSCIYKNIGWNVGLQNLHERVLTFKDNKWVVNLSEPLVFFNFKECLEEGTEVKKMIKDSGATKLLSRYKERLKQYTAVIPPVFSLRKSLHSPDSAFRKGLKDTLRTIVDTITYFPIYHKISK